MYVENHFAILNYDLHIFPTLLATDPQWQTLIEYLTSSRKLYEWMLKDLRPLVTCRKDPTFLVRPQL